MTADAPAAAVFSGLVAGIAATAEAMLEQVGALIDGKAGVETPALHDAGTAGDSPGSRADVIRTGLANARQYIDTLAVLQQKTKGNLTQEEEKLLDGLLTALRITFVKLNDRWASAKSG